MLEKGKIASFQMGILMYPTILATAILSLPGTMAKYANNDLWISPFWASLIGFLTVFIAFRLHKLYPKETIIQYSEHIVGNIPGKILGFIFVFYYLNTTGQIVRIYAEFIVGAFFPQTPISVIISTMVLFCAFAVRGGVEVLGRSAQIFVPILFFSFLFMIFLLLPDMEPMNIFPVMEHGLMPSIMGAIVPQSWFTEFILISFLLPYLTDAEKGMKWGMFSVLAVMLTMVVTNLSILFLLGGNISIELYPILIAARYISIADFFENLESVVMAIWILGNFVKISVFYYATALGTAQWLNLSDYRPYVLPIGFLLVLFSFWDIPNLPVLSRLDVVGFAFYGPFVQTIIPLLLLLIAILRKRI